MGSKRVKTWHKVLGILPREGDIVRINRDYAPFNSDFYDGFRKGRRACVLGTSFFLDMQGVKRNIYFIQLRRKPKPNKWDRAWIPEEYLEPIE
jgi:hypothetical protein